MTPAVVVLAYDRPRALERLLTSIAGAAYPGERVPLVISIDPGGSREVGRLAEHFSWSHGRKQVLVADRHLGLVAHVERASDLAREHGAIILLEDDLVVSPSYYSYAASALDFYREDPRIAGVSLYALWFNGYNHFPFLPLLDGADVFFLQIPYTQGYAFSAQQWARFLDWRTHVGDDSRPGPRDPLHPMLLEFGAEEWFPERLKYLVATDRYFVYPRESLTTGFGDVGTHFTRTSRWFQVPLQEFKTSFGFAPLDASAAVYDSFFEILPDRLRRLAPNLDLDDCDIDLYGSKPAHVTRHRRVVTSRRSRAPEVQFGRVMWPLEANVAHQVPGREIVLSRTADVRRGRWEDVRVHKELHEYFTRGRGLPRRLRWAFRLLDLWERRPRL